MQFWWKACPRCQGDLQMQEEIEDRYVRCIQCGFELTRIQEVLLRRKGFVPRDLRAAFHALQGLASQKAA